MALALFVAQEEIFGLLATRIEIERFGLGHGVNSRVIVTFVLDLILVEKCVDIHRLFGTKNRGEIDKGRRRKGKIQARNHRIVIGGAEGVWLVDW